MAIISTVNITAKIDPLWNDRSRDITYGESVSRLPYKVEVTDPGTATDVDELEEYVIAAAIEYFTSNPVGDTYFTRLSVDSTLNERTWKVVATFEGRGPWYSEASSGNLPEFDFDTMGGQVHITASRSVAGAYPLGASEFYPGAIGVQGDSIAGTDIIVPAFNFNLTLMLDSIFVNDAYLQLLRLLTGSVNSDNWYGYAPGEVLFLGASGQRKGAESIRLTYKFSALPNQTLANGNPVYIPGFVYQYGAPRPDGANVGDPIPVDKLGWQYLWVQYHDDTLNNSPIVVPRFVFVEDVYLYKAFSALGI